MMRCIALYFPINPNRFLCSGHLGIGGHTQSSNCPCDAVHSILSQSQYIEPGSVCCVWNQEVLSCIMTANLIPSYEGLTDNFTIDANGPLSRAVTALQIAQPRKTRTRTAISTALINVLHHDLIQHLIALVCSCT